MPFSPAAIPLRSSRSRRTACPSPPRSPPCCAQGCITTNGKMAPVGHFFGWGVIVQIAAIIHWSRKRPATYWLFIIIFFGFLGALAYFLVEGIDFDAMGRSVRGPSRRRRIH